MPSIPVFDIEEDPATLLDFYQTFQILHCRPRVISSDGTSAVQNSPLKKLQTLYVTYSKTMKDFWTVENSGNSIGVKDKLLLPDIVLGGSVPKLIDSVK